MRHTGVQMAFQNIAPLNGTLLSIARHMAPDTIKPAKKKVGRGRTRANAKLTKEQVIEIMARRTRGQTIGQISRAMKLPESSVNGVATHGNGARTLGI